MTVHALSTRWRAVHDLQRRRSAYPPDSLPSRIADHAASLALSPKRAPGPYLAHNALRDARIIVLRRDRLDRSRFPASFYGTPENPDSLDIRHEVVGELDGAQVVADAEADERLEWLTLYQRIRAELVGVDPRLAEVFDGWRDSESVADSAARLGISQGYVKKLRRRAGQIAMAIWAE